MIIRSASALFILAFGIALGAAVSNALRADASKDPVRPQNVPGSALWAGGPDGGMWVDCRVAEGLELECHVYADVTGVLVEGGRFAVDPGTIHPAFYSAGLIDAEVRLLRRGR